MTPPQRIHTPPTESLDPLTPFIPNTENSVEALRELLARKEEEARLAAEIGQSLLQENTQLKSEVCELRTLETGLRHECEKLVAGRVGLENNFKTQLELAEQIQTTLKETIHSQTETIASLTTELSSLRKRVTKIEVLEVELEKYKKEVAKCGEEEEVLRRLLRRAQSRIVELETKYEQQVRENNGLRSVQEQFRLHDQTPTIITTTASQDQIEVNHTPTKTTTPTAIQSSEETLMGYIRELNDRNTKLVKHLEEMNELLNSSREETAVLRSKLEDEESGVVNSNGEVLGAVLDLNDNNDGEEDALPRESISTLGDDNAPPVPISSPRKLSLLNPNNTGITPGNAKIERRVSLFDELSKNGVPVSPSHDTREPIVIDGSVSASQRRASQISPTPLNISTAIPINQPATFSAMNTAPIPSPRARSYMQSSPSTPTIDTKMLQSLPSSIITYMRTLNALTQDLFNRLRSTEAKNLNRSLRRNTGGFDLVELSKLSNSILDNILVDVNKMTQKFALQQGNEYENALIPIIANIAKCLAEIGVLRKNLNDVSLGYYEKLKQVSEKEAAAVVLNNEEVSASTPTSPSPTDKRRRSLLWTLLAGTGVSGQSSRRNSETSLGGGNNNSTSGLSAPSSPKKLYHARSGSLDSSLLTTHERRSRKPSPTVRIQEEEGETMDNTNNLTRRSSSRQTSFHAPHEQLLIVQREGRVRRRTSEH